MSQLEQVLGQMRHNTFARSAAMEVFGFEM